MTIAIKKGGKEEAVTTAGKQLFIYLMDKQFSNPCTRCGKERIDSKTWKEEITTFFGTSTITHTDTVCPDPECQRIVEKKIAVQREHSLNLQKEREKRMQKNLENRKKAKTL